MTPFIYYVLFSYPIMAGVIWESENKDFSAGLFVWVLSPLLLPVYLGMFLSKHYNK